MRPRRLVDPQPTGCGPLIRAPLKSSDSVRRSMNLGIPTLSALSGLPWWVYVLSAVTVLVSKVLTHVQAMRAMNIADRAAEKDRPVDLRIRFFGWMRLRIGEFPERAGRRLNPRRWSSEPGLATEKKDQPRTAPGRPAARSGPLSRI